MYEDSGTCRGHRELEDGLVCVVVRPIHLSTHTRTHTPHTPTQFFDKDGDGILKAEDLSRLPLHSLPNPLPKPTEDYTGRYQNSGTTPTEMNFGNKAVHQ